LPRTKLNKMKIKLSIIALALFTVASFSSCKKDYTCECSGDGESFKYEYPKMKKKDAQEACDLQGKFWNSDDIKCELK
jgi:hypothetical protein